jgi:hypothetical protein
MCATAQDCPANKGMMANRHRPVVLETDVNHRFADELA